MWDELRDYVASQGFSVKVLSDNGIQMDMRGWEHHSYLVEITNGRTGASMQAPVRNPLGVDAHPSTEVFEIVRNLVDIAGSVKDGPSLGRWSHDNGYGRSPNEVVTRLYQESWELLPGVITLLGSHAELDRIYPLSC
jgi:hypothetical protein